MGGSIVKIGKINVKIGKIFANGRPRKGQKGPIYGHFLAFFCDF